MTFVYELQEGSSWPPQGGITPPYSPSLIEIIRSCPLRIYFSTDKRYQRRTGSAARIGTAMHKTIRYLSDEMGNLVNRDDYVDRVSEKFLNELALQKEQSQEYPRERSLTWDPSRISAAHEAVISEALRLKQLPYAPVKPRLQQPVLETNNISQDELPLILPAMEMRVQSCDKLMIGYIDRIEEVEEGIRIIDYKSAAREDLPERYERQIQLYAKLFFDTTGLWPREGVLFYPLLARIFFVAIDKATCNAVYEETKQVVSILSEKKNKYALAKPGDVCKVCEFRPWCNPFWHWIEGEEVLVNAKEKAIIGFEGIILGNQLKEHYWRLELKWRNKTIHFAVPQERFRHLAKAKAGQKVKFIDTLLHGSISQPTIRIYDTSEIFLVK